MTALLKDLIRPLKLTAFSGVLATAYLLKTFYSRASSEDLAWIIAPTASVVEMVSHLNFVREAGYGWVDFEHLVVIAPACAGVNFFIMAFAMSAFQVIRHTHTRAGLIGGVAIAAVASYGLTVGANVLRVVVSTHLYRNDYHAAWLSPAAVHRIAGICIFYLFLSGYFRLFEYVLAGKESKHHKTDISDSSPHSRFTCLTPLFWYLGFSVGVPFVNNAARNTPDTFAGHVLTICGVTLALTMLMCLFHKGWTGFRRS